MKRKQPKEFYSEIDQIADKQAFIESISEGFKEVNDPRAADNLSYSLIHLLKDVGYKEAECPSDVKL
jgi:hypothetical protein